MTGTVNITRLIQIVVGTLLLLLLLLALAGFLYADRHRVGAEIEALRAQVEANEKRVDEAHNNIRFLTIRVDDLEADLKTTADYAQAHTHVYPGQKSKTPFPITIRIGREK